MKRECNNDRMVRIILSCQTLFCGHILCEMIEQSILEHGEMFMNG